MNRRQRRASGKRKHISFSSFSEVVDRVLGDMDDLTVMVGPILRNEDIAPGKCCIIVARSQKGIGFNTNRIILNSRDEAEHFRHQFILELSSRRPPLVVHDFDDEGEMVKWCKATWPCEKTARILRGVET